MSQSNLIYGLHKQHLYSNYYHYLIKLGRTWDSYTLQYYKKNHIPMYACTYVYQSSYARLNWSCFRVLWLVLYIWARHVGEKCMCKTFHSYFTDISCKLYTQNIRWQVSGWKFWPIVRVERGLTLGGHFWPTQSSSDCST